MKRFFSYMITLYRIGLKGRKRKRHRHGSIILIVINTTGLQTLYTLICSFLFYSCGFKTGQPWRCSCTALRCTRRTSASSSPPPAELPALLWWYGGREIPRRRNRCSARTHHRRGCGRGHRARPGRRTTRRRRPGGPATAMQTSLSASRTTCDPSVHIPWPHVPPLRRAIDMCGTRTRGGGDVHAIFRRV